MKFKRNDKYATIMMYVIFTLIIAAVIALVFFKFSAIKSIGSAIMAALAPVTYGFIIAYLCNPLVKLFEKRVFKFKKAKKDKKRLKRALSIIVTFIIVFAFIAAFLLLLIPQIGESYESLSANMNTYIGNVQNFIKETSDKLKSFLDRNPSIAKIINIDEISDQAASFISGLSNYLGDAAKYIINSFNSILNELKNLLIGLFLSFYMLYSREKICAQIKKLLAALTSRKTYLNIVSLTRFTDRAFGGFITGKILDSIIIGLVSFIVYGILGFNYYPLMAVITAVTNIIPIFGPFIGAGIIGILLLIAQPSKLLLFIIVVIIIQQVDGNIVGPKILGGTIGLSGMWVMISIAVAGSLFGLPGMLLGVPTFAVIYSLLRELSETRLKRKEAPHVTASYLDDPPEKDYLHSRIFIHRDEDIPESMMYPSEVEIEPEVPKKPLIVKIEEKAIEKAKSKKKSKKNKE